MASNKNCIYCGERTWNCDYCLTHRIGYLDRLVIAITQETQKGVLTQRKLKALKEAVLEEFKKEIQQKEAKRTKVPFKIQMERKKEREKILKAAKGFKDNSHNIKISKEDKERIIRDRKRFERNQKRDWSLPK